MGGRDRCHAGGSRGASMSNKHGTGRTIKPTRQLNSLGGWLLLVSSGLAGRAWADALNMPTLVGWGWYGNGQTNTPADLANVSQVACGYAHTYALKNDGTLVGWGDNWSGQTNTPADLANVSQVACGRPHA
ncbi:MAG: hypothetical protein FJ292_10470, partial [Planctomycetes bacterium]|nr:hypothetical protein [Planctomycetota bacterium]